MKTLPHFWTDLAPRERSLLILSLAVLIPFLVWALLWQPLRAAHEAARKAHAETAIQLAEVRQLAAELAHRTGLGRSPTPSSPQVVVEHVLRDLGLEGHLKRREAEGAQGLRLALENAPAEAVIRLLEQLEQLRVHIIQAQLDPADPGRMHALLTLQVGGDR